MAIDSSARLAAFAVVGALGSCVVGSTATETTRLADWPNKSIACSLSAIESPPRAYTALCYLGGDFASDPCATLDTGARWIIGGRSAELTGADLGGVGIDHGSNGSMVPTLIYTVYCQPPKFSKKIDSGAADLAGAVELGFGDDSRTLSMVASDPFAARTVEKLSADPVARGSVISFRYTGPIADEISHYSAAVSSGNSGMTDWLVTRRPASAFSLQIPASAEPGEYSASFVLDVKPSIGPCNADDCRFFTPLEVRQSVGFVVE